MPRGRRSKSKTKNKQKSNIDLQVVILILFSILSAIIIYVKSGYIGENLSPILGGLVGWIKYIIPIGIFSIALCTACEKDKQYITTKLLQFITLLICISTIITVFKGDADISKEFEEAVVAAYNTGSKNIGGGALGTAFAIPLIKLIGQSGTVALAIGVGSIVLVFLYGIRPAEILKEKIDERKSRERF